MNTPSVWYNTQPRIGSMITGAQLKDYINRDWIRPTLCMSGAESFQPDALSFSGVEDYETWIIGINKNCGTLMFIQLLISEMTCIETDTYPENSPALEHHG